jgi:hypothetical protein
MSTKRYQEETMRTLRFNLYAALLALVGIFFMAGPASAKTSGKSHHHSSGHHHSSNHHHSSSHHHSG